MLVALVCQMGGRRASTLCYRSHSTYVRRMRYMFDLKDDDDACRQAYNLGNFYLFYNFSPLLQQKGKIFLAPKIHVSEIKRILKKFRQTEERLEDSMLVGCSDQFIPYFALDLGSLDRSAIESELKGSFADLRKSFFQLGEEDAALISLMNETPFRLGTEMFQWYCKPPWEDFRAQAVLRWHENNQYCGKTGQPTKKNLSGSKRICHSSGIIYYPQTSPVVITLVSDGSRCLLVRQTSFPKGMYSALSGFCDVGESVEEAVRREVAEEVGLEVESLWYSASQHWPFPNSSLMIACHAMVRPQQSKVSINSQELEAAEWFSREEVVKALGRDPKSFQEKDDHFSFWVPPKQAIAHQLIQEWVKEQATITGPV